MSLSLTGRMSATTPAACVSTDSYVSHFSLNSKSSSAVKSEKNSEKRKSEKLITVKKIEKNL
jgi:hypothetical protein